MNDERLKLLIQDLLDGCISDSDLSDLESELQQSEDARRLYIECAELHSLLGQKVSVSQVANNVVPIDLILKRQRSKTLRLAALAAVAMLVIGLISTSLIMMDKRPALAFDAAPGSKFTLSHGDDTTGSHEMVMQLGSRLQLSRGMVELSFESGVRSILRAPAEITLIEDDVLFMDQGTAWFEVPENATGFTVNTKDLGVVDLGTEFGVISKPEGHDEVHVFKGKVEVSNLHQSKESIVLYADDARKQDETGGLVSIEASPEGFLKSLNDLPSYLYWSFDREDHFDVKGNHHAAESLVLSPQPSASPPELVDGKFGTALSLNGKQQCLTSDWEGIYGDFRPLSTAVWVRIPEGVDLTRRPAIVGWGISTGSKAKWKVQVTHQNISDPTIARLAIGGRYFDGETRINDGQWHHIAAVFYGNDPVSGEPGVDLYVDGRREKLTDYSTSITSEYLDEYEEIRQSPDARPLTIGKGVMDQAVTFRGLIDELYIFDGAISQEMVNELITGKRK